MKVTFLCVWSFLKDYVTWEDLLSRTLKLSLLLRIMICVWFLSVVSVLVGVHVTGVWNLQQFHSSQECFFWRPLHTLTHTLTLARRCWPGHRLLCVMMVFTGCVLSCSVRLDFLHGFSARFPHFSPPPLPLHLFLFASWLFLPLHRPKFASWRKNVGLRVSSSTCCPKSWRSSVSTLESLISSALSP